MEISEFFQKNLYTTCKNFDVPVKDVLVGQGRPSAEALNFMDWPMSFFSKSSYSNNAPCIIGITGGTGSGKTILAQALQQHFDPDSATLLHTDDYYHDRSDLPLQARKKVNFDHPDACDTSLLIAHLHALAAGQSIDAPRYDFVTHTRLSETARVQAKPLIILEGLTVFANSTVRNLLQLLVFVETPDDVRCIRRLRRDVLERGRTVETVVEQYLATVRPMHEMFVKPIREVAHVKVSGEMPLSTAVEAVVSHVRKTTVSVGTVPSGSGCS